MMFCRVIVALALGVDRALAFKPNVAGFLNAKNRPVKMTSLKAAKTLYDKVFEAHTVTSMGGGGDSDTVLMYIDRHLVHEVTSPQAFEGLRTAGRPVRRPDCTLATADHNVPTSDRSGFVDVKSFIAEPDSRGQVMALEDNVKDFGITYFGLDNARQGIVHIIGPEQGFTQPGMTIVCGDSHTATHGAFGSLAFGIGTSEVEHVLATQTLVQAKAKNMRVQVNGPLEAGVTSKDLILHVIGVIGTAGGTGCVVEFCGEAVAGLSMEGRMSVCNMAIEAGARAGMIAPDDVTLEYLKGRTMAPTGEMFEQASEYWKALKTDEGAKFEVDVQIDAADIAPSLTWGTSPQDVSAITGFVPDPADMSDPQRRAAVERSLKYMGFKGGEKLDEVPVDKVFIGSCTNARIEDIRAAAEVAQGRKVAPNIKAAMVVPGSGLVKIQAELEGLHTILTEAGFDWREPGCSMCLAMNPDKLEPQERCASTSNRNFEGRQGNGGRTHLVSPAMAAAAAVTGTLTDVRLLKPLGGGLPKVDLDFSGLEFQAGAVTEAATLKPMAAKDGGGGAGMDAFTVLKGVAAKLDIQNIDTDMIIPKQFLKTIKRTGLGVSAFFEMRYDPATGEPNPDFVLNRQPFNAAKILVTGDNFGCGSSREHAPWSLLDQGIKCIVATSFADIFYNNCFKNGMLPIRLPEADVRALMEDCDQELELEVDLVNQVIRRSGGSEVSFEVDAFRKHCLVNGLDDIGLTLEKASEISQYEAKRNLEAPWTFNLATA